MVMSRYRRYTNIALSDTVVYYICCCFCWCSCVSFFLSILRVRRGWRRQQRRWIGCAAVAFCNFSSFAIVLFEVFSPKIIHVENVRQLIPSGTCMNHHESLDPPYHAQNSDRHSQNYICIYGGKWNGRKRRKKNNERKKKKCPNARAVIKCIHVWKYNEYACVSIQHRWWWVSKWANINAMYKFEVYATNIRTRSIQLWSYNL